MALTQAGRENESLDVLDHAIDLATTVGEPLSQFLARIRRSELLLFSVGEPDSAFVEAASAGELWSQTREEALRIEPLALMAIVEARNGRKDRAEKAFCDAAGLLEKQPVDKLVLERMMLSLAAAMLLESRHDLNGMNARYGEAMVLAAGTDSPEYWGATISLQHGRSLLRLSRPKEARAHLEEASRRFDRLGNAVQSARVKRAVEESKVGPVLD
jgi:tetratricopeptide (TPR) repeat protein